MKLIDAVDIMERLQSCLTTPSIPCSCSSSSLSRAGGLMVIEFLPCWAHARHILVRAGTFNTHGSVEVQAVEHREESILSKTMPCFLFSQLVNPPYCLSCAVGSASAADCPSACIQLGLCPVLMWPEGQPVLEFFWWGQILGFQKTIVNNTVSYTPKFVKKVDFMLKYSYHSQKYFI